MKRNDSYVLRKLYGIPYLMTFGQSRADLCRGVKLNETGEFLWNLLGRETDRENLISELEKHYKTPEDNFSVADDLDNFLKELIRRGILEEDTYSHTDDSPPFMYISIAGINLRLCGPSGAFYHSFESFRIEKPDKIHQTITLINDMPPNKINGTLLLRNNELTVVESADCYVLFFPSSPEIIEAHMSKDGKEARFYYIAEINDTFRENMFHAIRLIYLYFIMRNDMSVIHSASLLYRNRLWLFSGISGTGKSTHTRLWHKLLDTPLINGDLNLISLKNNQAAVHGIPWCGTSEIFDTKTHELGGIILLKQSPDNYVEELTPDKKSLLISQRLITPVWTEDMLDMNLDFTDRLLPHILVCRLHCSISDEAVYTIKNRIDGYLSETGAE